MKKENEEVKRELKKLSETRSIRMASIQFRDCISLYFVMIILITDEHIYCENGKIYNVKNPIKGKDAVNLQIMGEGLDKSQRGCKSAFVGYTRKLFAKDLEKTSKPHSMSIHENN